MVSTLSSKEVTRLEEMISDLQVAKQQTWEEKERLSRMYENERKNNLANKVANKGVVLRSCSAGLYLPRAFWSW